MWFNCQTGKRVTLPVLVILPYSEATELQTYESEVVNNFSTKDINSAAD